MPSIIQNKIENLIYNEVTDATGCIASVNQIISKILLNQMGCDELDTTPSITHSLIQKLDDAFLKSILLEYLNISKENYNARISFLYCKRQTTRLG